MKQQLFFGSTPVPYTVAWTGETDRFLGMCPYAKRTSLMESTARGVGKPKFGSPHYVRQREAVARQLCDLCGKSLKNRTKVSLSQARPQPHAVDPFDILQVEPLLHKECAAICIKWCPSLKNQLADGGLNIRQVFRHRCQFAIYSAQGVYELVGIRRKAIAHAKVHIQAFKSRDLAWLTGERSGALSFTVHRKNVKDMAQDDG